MRLHLPAADARLGRLVLLALSVLFALILYSVARAESATEAVYRLPDPAIVDVVDALPTPSVSLSPNREWMQEWLDTYVENGPADAPATDQETAR